MEQGTGFNSMPLPSVTILKQKTRADLVNWKNNCQRKAEEFSNRSTEQGDFFDVLASAMAEKALCIETFLRKNPDHYGAEVVSLPLRKRPNWISQSTMPNPFRPTQEELGEKEDFKDKGLYQIGPNGKSGYPIPPLTSVLNGSVVENDRKRKLGELRDAAEFAKEAVLKMKKLKKSFEEAGVVDPPNNPKPDNFEINEKGE